MRSTEKTVLFARHTADKKTITYPVAVFNGPRTAAQFKTHLNAAHVAGDLEAVRALAPAIKLTEDGALHNNIAFATLVLSYEPEVPETAVAGESFEL